jgi:hypothetical protein
MIKPTIIDAVDASLGSGLVSTNSLDNKRAVMAIRSASSLQEREEIIQLVLEKRARHRTWITTTQRQWQQRRRTVTPKSILYRYNWWGQKHDLEALCRAEVEAIETRERYVRCQ